VKRENSDYKLVLAIVKHFGITKKIQFLGQCVHSLNISYWSHGLIERGKGSTKNETEMHSPGWKMSNCWKFN